MPLCDAWNATGPSPYFDGRKRAFEQPFRLALIRALAATIDERAIIPFSVAIRDESDAVVEVAVEVLISIGSRKAVTILTEAIAEKN